MQAVAMANFAMQSLKIKRVGILVDTQSNYSVALAGTFQQQFVGTIRLADYASGDVNYQSAIQYLKKQRTQAIYVPGYYPDVAVIMQQARKLNFSGLFLGGDGWDSESFPEMAGSAAEGSLFTTHFAKDDPRNTLQLPDGIGALFYDAMAVLSDALERSLSPEGQGDRNTLQKALLETHEFPVSTGKLSFDANHNALRPLVILEVHPQGFSWHARWPE
jgi:branched-chain amino acid transport system substrate-binding protein